jgi:hypothetical protein
MMPRMTSDFRCHMIWSRLRPLRGADSCGSSSGISGWLATATTPEAGKVNDARMTL